MEGRRSPIGGYPQCPWFTGTVVIGYGEKVYVRIPFIMDQDIFYDPYDVYDGIYCRLTVYDPLGHEESGERWADAYVDEQGRTICFINWEFCPQMRGTWTVVCTMDDGRQIGDPAHDAPVIRQINVDVQCWFRINEIFSTDLTTTDSGSPKAGLVGVDMEWTAAMPPRLQASHMCDYLYNPQIVESGWMTLSEERPPTFPHRGKYYFPSVILTQNAVHNSDGPTNWTLTAGPGYGATCYFDYEQDWEELKVEDNFEIHNLSVESTGAEYLKYDPETGSGNTITYKLNDAYVVCPLAQETLVTINIYTSDGIPVRTDSFTKTAGRDRTYTYIWDGLNWEGEPVPKGIYIYLVDAGQYALIPDPTIPGNYIQHSELDMDKSSWSLVTSAEIVACNESTGASTVRVSFVVDPGIMPEGANWKIDHAKVEVFDPDLIPIAGVQVGESPVAQTVYFPDLDINFNKGGTYVFLVSAWDNLYPDRQPINRTHEC